MLNSTNSTRIVLFILCVISFQMLSDGQSLSTIQNGTPGSGEWMGNNGLAPWVLGRVKMHGTVHLMDRDYREAIISFSQM